MNGYLIGELFAFGVAVNDAITCTCVNYAEKRVSTFTVNFVKTMVAFLGVTVLRLIATGTLSLTGTSLEAWIYLSVSGVVGFVLGDFFYFYSFLYLPYRVSMMIYYASPIVTSMAAWALYGQKLKIMDWFGIVLVIAGLCIVLLAKSSQAEGSHERKQLFRGVIYAFLGMLGQAGGILLSNRGIQLLPAAGASFTASQIRLIAGVIGLFVMAAAGRKFKAIGQDMKCRKEMGLVFIGGLSGCAIGTTLTLQSLRYLPVGISAAITSISPVLVLPFTALILKEKIKWVELWGAMICIAGIVVLSL